MAQSNSFFRNGNYRTSKIVKVLDNTTKWVKTFPSCKKAREALGLSDHTLKKWLNSDGQVLFEGRYQAKLGKVTKDWKIFPGVGVDKPIEDTELSRQTHYKSFLVRNFETKKVIRYEDSYICGMALGVCSATVHQRAKTKGQVVYQDGFQVKYEDDTTPWSDEPPITEGHSTRKEVLVRDIKTNNVVKYASMKACSDQFNISRDKLLNLLKSDGKVVYFDHFQFKYAGSKTIWGKQLGAAIVLDIPADKLIEFDSVYEVARTFQICYDFLKYSLISGTKQCAFKGRYLVKLKNDERSWKQIYSPVFRISP